MNKRDTIRIYAEDGNEFVGTNYEELIKQRDVYEEELRQKKAKEEAERKAREEKQKKLLQFRKEKLNDINAKAKELSDMIKDYEEATNRSLYYTFSDDGLVVKERTRSYDDLLNDFFKPFWF